jgi:hypothetical protein
MKHFFENLFVLVLFLLSTSLFFFALTSVFFSPLINILMFIVAIFFLLQGCSKLDKALGLGDYNHDKDDNEQA